MMLRTDLDPGRKLYCPGTDHVQKTETYVRIPPDNLITIDVDVPDYWALSKWRCWGRPIMVRSGLKTISTIPMTGPTTSRETLANLHHDNSFHSS